MRKFLVPVVGALLAMLFTTGAAAASGDEPSEPPEPHRSLVAMAGEESEEFIDCLREHGVDVDESENLRDAHRRLRLDEDGEEAKRLRAAFEECRSLLPEEARDGHRRVFPAIPPERAEELRQRLGEFHDCLREHGVDVDVEESEDGRRRHLQFLHDATEEEREEFRKAVEACGGTVPGDLDELPALDGPPLRSDA